MQPLESVDLESRAVTKRSAGMQILSSKSLACARRPPTSWQMGMNVSPCRRVSWFLVI